MDTVEIEKVNEVYNRIRSEPSIMMELSEYFTFDVPGAKFTPMYRNKVWDGKIRLLNVMTGLLYAGLNRYVAEFCKQRDYEIGYISDFSADPFSVTEAEQFIHSLNLTLTPRDYQKEAFIHAVRERRALLLSPTSSGKSLIIYLLTRYYNARTLIIVPTISLVSQLYTDFADYGYNSDLFVHRIYGGQSVHTDKQITISTWQSLYKLPKEYFKSFDVVIGDEAHLYKAKSLTSILHKLTDCKYRFGLTGTLDGTQTNKLVLEGLFGPVRKVITTSELIEQKFASDFRIKAIVLSYPDEIRKMIIRAMDYQAELDYIVTNNARNKFIANLALSLKGNTLILFQFVEKHGKVLYDMIKDQGKNVYYVSGEIDGETRETIRKSIENEEGAIIIASSGTFSTGINIKKLHNIIFSSPSKSRVKNLQSIGRVLRKSENKDMATLFDIADDLSWKTKKNYTILHFMERVKIYNEEGFQYKIYNVTLKT